MLEYWANEANKYRKYWINTYFSWLYYIMYFGLTVADNKKKDAVEEKFPKCRFDIQLGIFVVLEHFSRGPHAYTKIKVKKKLHKKGHLPIFTCDNSGA